MTVWARWASIKTDSFRVRLCGLFRNGPQR
nr:MAG TPA: hypothetical protein [Caudoviricetes sp.]